MYELIVQLIVGALGGNLIGTIFKNMSLGFVGNTLAGLVGGGLSGFVLNMFGVTIPGVDASNLTTLLPSIGAGAGGGGIVMLVVGAIKSMMDK